MALITRVSRLFRADLHAVLDRIEEPDILLRQAVREMEEALTGDERRIKLLVHEQGELNARAQGIEQTLADIDEELDLCFASDKDDLARALIRRKLEAQRTQKQLRRSRETLARTLTGLSQRLEERRGQLEGMRQKLALLAEDRDGGPSDDGSRRPEPVLREEDVEVAFLREKQRRSRR